MSMEAQILIAGIGLFMTGPYECSTGCTPYFSPDRNGFLLPESLVTTLGL